jgi:hypothetical protein
MGQKLKPLLLLSLQRESGLQSELWLGHAQEMGLLRLHEKILARYVVHEPLAPQY